MIPKNFAPQPAASRPPYGDGIAQHQRHADGRDEQHETSRRVLARRGEGKYPAHAPFPSAPLRTTNRPSRPPRETNHMLAETPRHEDSQWIGTSKAQSIQVILFLAASLTRSLLLPVRSELWSGPGLGAVG